MTSALSFHHVGPREQAQIVRFGGKHPSPLSHLAGLILIFQVWKL